MLHHIPQNRFATRWKYSAGKFYPMRVTHQTWLLPISVCVDVSRTYWTPLRFVRRCETMAGRMVCSKLPERWKKRVTSDRAYFERSNFYHSFEFNVFFKEKSPNFILALPVYRELPRARTRSDCATTNCTILLYTDWAETGRNEFEDGWDWIDPKRFVVFIS